MYKPKSNIRLSIKQVAELVQARIIGSEDGEICGLCSIDEARPDAVGFIRASSPFTVQETIKRSVCKALLIEAALEGKVLPRDGSALLFVPDPYAALQSLVATFFEVVVPFPGLSPLAFISPSAKVHPSVHIGPFAVIGDEVEVGEGSVIGPHVTLYPLVRVGSHCILHAGVVLREATIIADRTVIQAGAKLGSDGFGFVTDPKMGLRAVPQIGQVIIGENVEIGANTCLDRATLGTTSVGSGSKIDNLVQVGHNTKIGSHCILCGGVGVAGSVSIGNQAVLGGQVGVADHCKIGEGVRLAGKSGVIGNDLSEKGDYAGFPAVPVHQWRKMVVALQRLPEVLRKLKT